MKAVLLSIQPKWCELIASGKKTVEVRKNRPKLETPFKCYIYETKDKHFEHIGVHYADGQDFIHHIGKVIGEFVCSGIDDFKIPHLWVRQIIRYDLYRESCVPFGNLYEYSNGGRKLLYGWHITDLVIYDKPKELSEFKRPCNGNCQYCDYALWETTSFVSESKIIGCSQKVSAPQSWCYVEALE